MKKYNICKTVFHDEIKPKHLTDFEVETPNKNIISGYICRKPNYYLGSMIITHVKTQTNEFDTFQYVQSMPKIHYYSNDYALGENYNFVSYKCYEKLDGTCLIFYPLFDNAGQIIEIIPKTRNLAVADSFILDMLKYIDTKNIEDFFKDYPRSTLLFELYGVLNRHEILYPQTYIDIALIGITKNHSFIKDIDMNLFAELYEFHRPKVVCSIHSHKNIWKMSEDLNIEYPTQYDCIIGLRDYLEEYNEQYKKRNNRIAFEGVVIYGKDESGKQMYMKIKPSDLQEKLSLEHGIPRKFILKEVRKYFTEYGSKVKEIYQKDKTHYFDYITRNLLEEFKEEDVKNKKTELRIEKVFFDMLEARTPPKGLQNICEELLKKYPKSDIGDLMRIFAHEYPEKKKQSRMVYSILEKRL